MHVNIIKGALWSLETEEVRLFYAFDLEARHMRTRALISNCGFQMYSFLSLYSRKEITFAFVSNEPRKIQPFTSERRATTSAN